MQLDKRKSTEDTIEVETFRNNRMVPRDRIRIVAKGYYCSTIMNLTTSQIVSIIKSLEIALQTVRQ